MLRLLGMVVVFLSGLALMYGVIDTIANGNMIIIMAIVLFVVVIGGAHVLSLFPAVICTGINICANLLARNDDSDTDADYRLETPRYRVTIRNHGVPSPTRR